MGGVKGLLVGMVVVRVGLLEGDGGQGRCADAGRAGLLKPTVKIISIYKMCSYWKCIFAMTPHVHHWLVGRSVIISQKKKNTSMLLSEQLFFRYDQ